PALVTVPTMTIATFAPSQPSLAVGRSNDHAVPHSTVLFAAQVNTGGVASTALTVWLHVAALPHASVAAHVRVALKLWPQPALVTVPTMAIATLAPSQPSLAVGGSKVHP